MVWTCGRTGIYWVVRAWALHVSVLRIDTFIVSFQNNYIIYTIQVAHDNRFSVLNRQVFAVRDL